MGMMGWGWGGEGTDPERCTVGSHLIHVIQCNIFIHYIPATNKPKILVSSKYSLWVTLAMLAKIKHK